MILDIIQNSDGHATLIFKFNKISCRLISMAKNKYFQEKN